MEIRLFRTADIKSFLIGNTAFSYHLLTLVEIKAAIKTSTFYTRMGRSKISTVFNVVSYDE